MRREKRLLHNSSSSLSTKGHLVNIPTEVNIVCKDNARAHDFQVKMAITMTMTIMIRITNNNNKQKVATMNTTTKVSDNNK